MHLHCHFNASALFVARIAWAAFTNGTYEESAAIIGVETKQALIGTVSPYSRGTPQT